MMDWNPRCYMPSFVEIGSSVPETKIFEGFYHIWAWLPSWPCDPVAAINFCSPYPRRLHIKFDFDWPASVRRRPSSFTMLKDVLLQNLLANQSQILCGSSLGRGERKFVRGIWVTLPRWPPRSYMVKTLQKSSSQADFHETWYVASGPPAHHSLFK